VNPIEIIASLLAQDAHEAERQLRETIARLHSKLSAINAFFGSGTVLLTKAEYEKDIEHRRDIFLFRVKDVVAGLSKEERRSLAPEISDLGRRWLHSHVITLEEELQNLASRVMFRESKMLDLGSDRVLMAIDAHLHIILSSQPAKIDSGDRFIDDERLRQLKLITSASFDLSRVIRLCEELDTAFAYECYQAVAMLTRAILDHIPPVFSCKSFKEVANNYAGTKSFKEVAQRLETTSRKLTDTLLHTQIRPKESLPTRTQVDVRQAFDKILEEVIRILNSA